MIALLTNDDGIDAEGLAALRAVAESLFDEVWVVAPAAQASQIGHRVTTDTPIRFEERGERTYAIHGTPADCTRVALAHLMPEKPDWVLAGINHGGNLGRHDFVISGTVAAVREAAFAGVKGVAFSHFMKRGLALDWDIAAARVESSFQTLLPEKTVHGEFWTVNLPHLTAEEREPEIIQCEQEEHPLLVVYEQVGSEEVLYAGNYHERPRRPGSDVDVCFRGDISVSKVSV
tara:strand:- start:6090 stop:6785 length:696 start_codon:yes stop_codon:yes gene_type:complete